MTNEPTTIETRKPRRWPWIVAVTAALFVGVGIGSASTEPAAVETPEPEPAVTVPAEPVVETVTETVEVTPQACADALDYAEATTTKYEELIELKSELIEITALGTLEVFLDEEGTFDAQLAEYNVRQDALIDEKDEALMAFVMAGLDCDPAWADR